MTEKVHGYKVFSPDWTCRDKQYTCPGKFEEKGKLSLCNHGMPMKWDWHTGYL